jgi:hypothetical protein
MKDHRTAAILSVLALQIFAAMLPMFVPPAAGQTNDPFAQWTRRDPVPGNRGFGCLIFADDRFMGAGELGVVFTSPDGTNWTCTGFSPVGFPEAVAYANGAYVMVGGGVPGMLGGGSLAGETASSADGARWVREDWPGEVSPTNVVGLSIAYGNGVFTALIGFMSAQAIMTSPNGSQWTAQTFGDISDIWDLVFGNGLFAAVASDASGDTFLLTSADGLLWTRHACSIGGSGAAGQARLVRLGYGNGTFVALAGWGGTGPYAAGILAEAVSPDCSLWTTNAVPWPDGITPQGGLGGQEIAYGNGTFLCLCDGGNVALSTNGLSWAIRSSGMTNGISCLAYGNGVFVATIPGKVSPPVVSSDGVHWTPARAAVTIDFGDVLYACGKFVAVGGRLDGGNLNNYFQGAGAAVTSTDGIQWSATSVDTQPLQAVTYAQGLFVAVGGGQAATSEDAVNWTSHDCGTTNILEGIAYGSGVFVAVGQNGTIVTSTNAADWVVRAVPWTNYYLGHVVYGKGVFVALPLYERGGGPILASRDGADWSLVNCGGTDRFCSLAYGNGVFVVMGCDTVQTSTNGWDWSMAGPTPWWETEGAVYIRGSFATFVGYSGIYTSTDATNWVFHDIGWDVGVSGLAYGNGTYIAVGGQGAVLQSSPAPWWPLRLAPLSSPGPYGFPFAAAGPVSRNWEIDVSSDLLGWTPLTNLWSTNTLLQVLDGDTSRHPRRFYRGEYW